MTDQPELIYNLEIVQEPVRARMCGLGDKDRRQISPPPFAKLNVIDSISKQPIHADSVDITAFVLVVELWSADEKEDLTLNQNIAGSPKGEIQRDKLKSQKDTVDSTPSTSHVQAQNQQSPTVTSDSDESLGEIPTRNIIGNLVLNPFKLFDDKNEKGIWFIMHDLSIRIEGEFKLKLLFMDLTTSKSSSIFSQAFKVYSAKKFPGVVDSSPLGKVFASQGVKIPIRRDAKGENQLEDS